MVVIKLIETKDTYEIRKKELRKNMDLSSQFTGDFDEDTFHLGLFQNEKLISIVSFMKMNNEMLTGEQYQLRGMATLVDFQGKGYGKMLVSKAEKILKKKNINLVWCNARVIALNFYKKQRFQVIGEEFDIPQIGGHYVMFKEI